MLTNTYIQIRQLLPYLTPEERERLAEELKSMIENEEKRPRHQITELEGLGKEIWEGTDAQEYVDRERDSWDNGPSYRISGEIHSESDKR